MSDKRRRSRWPIVAGVCIGALVAMVTAKLTTPQVFEARAVVALNLDELPREFVRRTVEDEIILHLPGMRRALLSDPLLHEVIVRTSPIPSTPEAEQYLADRIRSRLSLRYTRQTTTIEFRYSDGDPFRAAEVVNVFAHFLGEVGTVSATPAAALVSPRFRDYLGVGVVGGLLGGLLMFLGRLLGLGAVAVRGLTLKALS